MLLERTSLGRLAVPGLSLVAALALLLPFAVWWAAAGEKDNGDPQPSMEETLPEPSQGATPEKRQAVIKAVLTAGTKAANARIRKDPVLGELAAKYPVVVLHSRRYAGGDYLGAAYSFIQETSDPHKVGGNVQILFDNGSAEATFDVSLTCGSSNLVADLGKVDFAANPNPKDVDIDGEAPKTWLGGSKAIEGDVYLERVREPGNKFYVLFKVIAVEKDSKYLAFLWRILPGGKVVKPK